ncbi:MAG: restriction endonuclease subunit S [Nitrospirae bacterium]|nr:restriction endonuclease subunit S [Nitrospirota bacterium]
MKQISLRQFITFERGFKLSRRDIVKGVYPVVASSAIIGYHNEYKVLSPGVIIGVNGALNEAHYINNNFWPHNNVFWVKDFKGNLPRYVYYYLKSLDLTRFDSGIVIPKLNRNDLYSIEIAVHDTISQQKIVNILSAYDELIEMNNRRIIILEELKQMTHKEWFVNLRFPEYDNTQKVNIDIGWIPKGWSIVRLRDVISSYIIGTWGNDIRDDIHSESAYVIRGVDIPKIIRCDIRKCSLRYHRKSILQNRKASHLDIVLEISGGTGGQLIGRSILMTKDILALFNTDVITTKFCKLIRIKNDIFSSYYFDQHIKRMYNDGTISKYRTQSTGITNIQFESLLDEVKIALPPKKFLEQYDEVQMNLYTASYNIGHMNSVLIKTRDLLLNKLIRGEIDVKTLDV